MIVQCSNCGKWSSATPNVLLERGWRAVGDADYCPKCAKKSKKEFDFVMTGFIWLRRLDAELSSRRKNEK